MGLKKEILPIKGIFLTLNKPPGEAGTTEGDLAYNQTIIHQSLKFIIMTSLANITQNYNGIKEGDLTHKRHFLYLKQTTRGSWYNRRRFSV